MDSGSELESKLVPLISQLIFLDDSVWEYSSDVISLIFQIISLANSVDLDSQPKPESEFMSLTTQTISLFNSMDFDSQPKPLRKLISFVSQRCSLLNSTDLDLKPDPDQAMEFMPLVDQTLKLKPEPELMSLIHQIFSLVISMNSKSRKLISVCPQVIVKFEDGRFHVIDEFSWSSNNKWHCLPSSWYMFRLTEEDVTHFRCGGCNGENHKEYDNAPVEINHALHPKHPLQLVLLQHNSSTRKCYCCYEDLNKLFYYCSACDIAINLACVDKPPVFFIDNPRCHGHTLTLFPSTSLTCDVCALADLSSPFYICSPCGFGVHRNCTRLPRVIKISRHHHRISLTPSLGQGDWSCGVCREKMDNDYGGYSCGKDGCWYAAHLECATNETVWDGREREGVPEKEDDEEDESSEMISGFSHQHRFRRYEDTGGDYDENKMCQACIMPIYFGNFYSCVGCDFILHEECVDFPPEINYPLHPHLLTLVRGYDGVMSDENKCSACPWLCTAGFFYKCSRELCRFKLHVQCATISEFLDHGSHEHPLKLSSKPGEQRACHVCKEPGHSSRNGTFNCTKKGEKCDFALCLKCVTLPPKVRYTDDEHVLILSYGKKTSTRAHWCEECERQIDQSVGFYMCQQNCCVTLHIECLLGVDLYMMPGSSWLYYGEKVDVLLNNRHASRPICSNCEKRCPHKIVLQCSGIIFCSTFCIRDSVDRGDKVA